MKTITRTRIFLPITAMILTAALASPAAAQTSCGGFAPGCVKGTFQGQHGRDTLVPPGATSVLVRTIATGTGTQLNQFLLVREVTVTPANFSLTGSAQWIAAKGDGINTRVEGQTRLSDIPGFLEATETHTITSGTGRFAGAQGSFQVELLHKLQPSGVAGGFQTFDVSGSFQGNVIFPGTTQ